MNLKLMDLCWLPQNLLSESNWGSRKTDQRGLVVMHGDSFVHVCFAEMPGDHGNSQTGGDEFLG